MTPPGPFDQALARMIDHTLLRPDATTAEVERLCAEGREFGFASICVNSTHVTLCAERIKGSGVKVCSTIGFPLGAASTAAKVFEAEQAIRDGAGEIDVVMNIGLLKSGNDEAVEEDIRQVAAAARRRAIVCKVILETGLLSGEEKLRACAAAERAGAHFVKTSTGFGHGGATIEDVRLMREAVGQRMGVKASGGIRTREDALAMIAAGANRIGASASIVIVTAAPDNRHKEA
jgi:deoxyribose-phosphate aldolase